VTAHMSKMTHVAAHVSEMSAAMTAAAMTAAAMTAAAMTAAMAR